jgi:hypothetical protein
MTNDEKVTLVSRVAATLYTSMTTNSPNKAGIAVDEAMNIIAAAVKKVKEEEQSSPSSQHLDALKSRDNRPQSQS